MNNFLYALIQKLNPKKGPIIWGVIIFSLMSFGIIMGYFDRYQTSKLLKEPTVGDVYVLNLKSISNNPTTPQIGACKIVRIVNDSVEFLLPKQVYTSDSPVRRQVSRGDTSSPNYYSQTTIIFSKTELGGYAGNNLIKIYR